jgi:hypothetical protein
MTFRKPSFPPWPSPDPVRDGHDGVRAEIFFRRISQEGFDKSCFSVKNCNILQFFAAF